MESCSSGMSQFLSRATELISKVFEGCRTIGVRPN